MLLVWCASTFEIHATTRITFPLLLETYIQSRTKLSLVPKTIPHHLPEIEEAHEN
jgi:hypothetical protein